MGMKSTQKGIWNLVNNTRLSLIVGVKMCKLADLWLIKQTKRQTNQNSFHTPQRTQVMLTTTSDTVSNPIINKSDSAIADLEKSIVDLDNMITPLRTKTQKKLNKIEEEITNCNFLIDSGLGSKKDQAELRKNKKSLRNRHVKLRDEMGALPALEEEREDLVTQLKDLRRRYGILDDDI
ncbi:expressed unknown protein [Seminavis robusta]|uniref:Uncharacterized protein n=1 Tax=Seminavis robusta TaxID=568900 RepID=A0A9N8HNA8_9STRA|nr:expressed unknown protein [Seminavis robusta]|eukprot:Sro806_g205170.1 n/a (179) ;mRNA; r:37661-38197